MSLLVSTCVLCGQTDDHPKDVVIYPGDLVARYHHDCHALADPPCESCQWLVQHKGELRGQDWREQIGAVHAAAAPGQIELPAYERDVIHGHRSGARP